jgi:hypothetical protein
MNYDINDINEKKIINNFWDEEIWKINFKSIKNNSIINIFEELKKMENEYNKSETKFNIDENYNIFIFDEKKNLKKKIVNFKKDNLNTLKLHSDCFIEYHNIIFEYFKKKINLVNNKENIDKENIDKENINKENINKENINKENINKENINKENINKENIDDHLYYFKNMFILDSKINNIENIYKTLNININNIYKSILNFTESINNKPILLIDVENILKSFKIQEFIKEYIPADKFSIYFNIWDNGYYKDNNLLIQDEISLSEYSSKIKYIEPYTSLNLNFSKKKKLIKLIIDKLLGDYNTINIITYSEYKNKELDKSNKSNDSSIINKSNDLSIINKSNDLSIINKSNDSSIINKSNDSSIINKSNDSSIINESSNSNSSIINESINYDSTIINEDNKHLYITIEYNKSDIREQDDHMIVFIYTLLKKFNYNTKIISNDKFKWFNNIDELNIQNFKILYDFDELKKKIIIDKPYTPDIFKINSEYITFPYINYPILKSNLTNNISIIYINKIINIIEIKLKKMVEKISQEDLENIFLYLFLYSIYEITDTNSNNILRIYEFLINYFEQITENLKKLFNFLETTSKVNIFKISIKSDIDKFTKHEIKNYIKIFDNYKILLEIYIIFKYIIFKLYSNIIEYNTKLTILFSYIITIYDLFDKYICKIRKLSISKSELNKLFLKMNIIYIYIRKRGYLKKNIL